MASQLDDVLAEARERFEVCVDAESDMRDAALDDLRFVNGEQWPEDVKRRRAGRPCHTNNRLPQFVAQVVNEQRRSRPAITVSPVGGGANVKTATVLQGMVRHIERVSRAEVAYDTAFQYAVTCSIGHFRITTDYVDDDSFDQELIIKRIDNPFTVYTDPHHHEPDAIDARYRFVTEMVDAKDFEKRYGFEPTMVDEVAQGDDNANWYDGDRVRVAEYWRIVDEDVTLNQLSDGNSVEGDFDKDELDQMATLTGIYVVDTRKAARHKVEQYLMTGDKVIKQSEWAGKYIPIVTVTGGELNIEGKKHRYSLIRFAKDAQRLDNFWSSAEAELLALQPKAPWLGPEGSFDGHEAEFVKANTENLPYLEYKPVPGQPGPTRQFFTGSPTGIREARMAAIEDMKAIMGMHDASLGARSNEVSGVAIRERTKQGDTATYHFIDAMAKAIESAGRILIDLIPKIYDSARVVRIIKPDDQAEMVAINQMFIDPQTGEMYQHDLAMGHYDVTVKVGPSFQSQREEARAAMLDFVNMYPNAGPIVGDLIVTNMDWPEADKFAERLKAVVPPQALGQPGPPDPMMQMEQAKIKQIEMKGQQDAQLKQMDLQMKQFELQLAQQEAQNKSMLQQAEMQAQQQSAAMKAENDRMALEIKRMEMELTAVQHQQTMEIKHFEVAERARQSDREDQLHAMRIAVGELPNAAPPVNYNQAPINITVPERQVNIQVPQQAPPNINVQTQDETEDVIHRGPDKEITHITRRTKPKGPNNG